MNSAAITRRHMIAYVTIVLTLTVCSGCHRDMRDQPRYEPYEPSPFFADGQSARPAIAGTVARGQLHEDAGFYTGKSAGQFVVDLPLKIDRPLLDRGQERFNIFCAPCHAPTGLGNGIIVQRGFSQPPSLHIDRLRDAHAGHFFEVITNGYQSMPRFADRLSARDRWSIVAYIRALQLSQNADLKDVPADVRLRLEKERS